MMKIRRLFFKWLTINYFVFVVAGLLIYPVLVVLGILATAVEAVYFFCSELKDISWAIDLSKNNFNKLHKHRWQKYEK